MPPKTIKRRAATQIRPKNRAILHNEGNIYSAYNFPPGAVTPGDKEVFKASDNEDGQGFAVPLTQSYTNVSIRGGLPVGFKMWVRSIGVEIQYELFREAGQLVEADVIPALKLVENTVLVYKYASVETLLGKVNQWPCGYGAIAELDWKQLAAANEAYFKIQNGRPSVEAVRPLAEPIFLDGTSDQRWIFRVTDAAAGTLTENMVMLLNLYGDYSDQIGETGKR